ncbi:MAG: tetratricopeptide repeat protein [Acidobacteriota bacterium]
MKKFILIATIGIVGCGGSPQVVQNSNNSTDQPQRSEKLQDVRAHTTENQPPKSVANGSKTKWTQSGNPIDTSEFDKAIAAAEAAKKAKSSDVDAKKDLADAYFNRGFALTDARQYASALGDYRRAIKLDPERRDAQDWIDQIVLIYDSMSKEYPKEGEEPPPLPFKKS